MIILEEHFKWHLEAFASELFILRSIKISDFWIQTWKRTNSDI